MKGNSYYSRKLHSLLGVIPLGFFIVEHMLTNFAAVEGGKEGFIEAVAFLNGLPLVLVLEIFGIWLPLLYHGVYGLYVAYQSRNNVTNYGYARNLMFTLQRITGVVTFVFVVWHLFETRFQVAIGKVTHEGLGDHMHEMLSNPVIFILYVIGILAASFHFCNGMWSFLVSWGITVGPRAQKASTYVWMGVFVILSVMFIMSLAAFASDSFVETAAKGIQFIA
ncbi:succinate dehydrogenase [Paenibacillus swuensis]|uniref:Succinate dehydrogenase n=1 Tax=Paenibacillus swuensis TaxID=1178515 RepID=A0A172TGS5_9BACL|nr:succinate dehydrogenase cytochrome b558 subunit [Paenibacillus swuensis]ANE46146.1 succinate dehydrogenase [Paenibacillus swuensis]